MNRIEDRVRRLADLLEMTVTAPPDWTDGGGGRSVTGRQQIECLECDRWEMMVAEGWRKALKWTDGLDCALSVMLAAVTSTKAVGSQLWVKLISPPSTAKTVLCEGLSVNRDYVVPKDTVTGLFSGYQVDKEGTENMSLVMKLKDKTLIIKDADTILQLPNRQQILSQFRALYDRAVRTSYGNMMSRDFEGMGVTVIFSGTSSMDQLDASELGERFLSVRIMDSIPDDLEDEILRRAAKKATRNLHYESDGTPGTHYDPETLRAMQLTGGYVGYLRENAKDLLASLHTPDDVTDQCMRLGKFVSYMRARPSKVQDESAERELAARLVEQIVRLANCLAVVLNRPGIDSEVMRRATKVALDTARGKTLEIAKHLHRVGRAAGAVVESLSVWTGLEDQKTQTLLTFLNRIGAVESFHVNQRGLAVKPRWRLTERLHRLYSQVMPVVSTQ